MAKLTKGQKKIRDAEKEESNTVIDPKRIAELFDKHSFNQSRLLARPEIWSTVKPLVVSALSSYPTAANLFQSGEYAEYLLENPALTDDDLAELQVPDVSALHCLAHVNCGDKCLLIISRLWESILNFKNIDCLTSWASIEQIERMYVLNPRCKTKNATLGAADFALQVKQMAGL